MTTARNHTSKMESLSQLIRRAINEGAPLYNDGKRKECYEVYMNAIHAATSEPAIADSAFGEMLSQASAEASAIVSAAGSSEDESHAYAEAAWVIRHCFDNILSREGDRSLFLTSKGMAGSDHTMGSENQWQDSKVGNSTDFEKGQAMADISFVLRTSITPRNHKRVEQSFDDCFEASEAVETLMGLGLGVNRKEAAEKCTSLLRSGLILPVSHPEDIVFVDGTHLYRFPTNEEVRASLDTLLLDDETKVDGTEQHVFMTAVQISLESPEAGSSETTSTFSGVSTRSLRPRPRPSILAAPAHFTKGVKLADFAAMVEATVDIEDRSYHLKMYKRCFVGKDAVSNLVEESISPSREEATSRLGELVHYGLLRHVTSDHEFRDKNYFYMFPSATEIKEALDIASEQVANGQEDDETAVRCAALGCRYKQLTGLDIASILNDFYGCTDESGWDVSDLDNWRTNMKRWGFGRREDQDDAMVARLAPLVQNINPDEWDKTDGDWESPWGILAQIAIFDQIPRSAFRGTPEAFKWDDLAIRATKRALDKGYFDSAYRSTLNQFVLLLPLEHSESWEDQKLGVSLLLRMLSTVSVEDEGYSDYEIVKRLEFSKRLTTAFLEHAQVIAKFKRYPHRNRAQGRGTTLEERIWLASDLVPRWAKSQNPDEASKNIVKAPVIPLKKLTRGR